MLKRAERQAFRPGDVNLPGLHLPSRLLYPSGALQIVFLIHAVAMRRNFYWIFILLIGSYLALLAYLILEFLPELRGGGRRVGAALRGGLEAIKPLETRIREARERLTDKRHPGLPHGPRRPAGPGRTA
ncbi:hypothetical protein [Deinococcus hopiensis]|uniref:hypothetical protein n=1 Tax=Deinococcus hopiensis TaxID=309885 RepID=UPI001FE4E98A|nr:hypothetical protein [Deinococcus hopiensis]